MPTNEFEKQVQEQLGELQLNPSASVWEKVEEQIREKKRRRIIFFFLLPLALGLIAFSFYHFLYTDKKRETVQQPVAAEKKSFVNDQHVISNETKEQPVAVPQKETGKRDIAIAEKTATKQISGAVAESGAEFSTTDPPAIRIKKNAGTITNNKRIQQQDDNLFEIISTTPGKQKIAIVAHEHIITNEPEISTTQTINTDKKILVDEVVITEKEAIPARKDSIKTEDVTEADNKQETIAIKKPGKSNIKWGIDLSAGLTANSDGVFIFAASNNLYDASGSLNSTTGNNPSTTTPSLLKSGPAFKVGFVAEWQVSQRSRFSAGLQYAYASNRIKTGTGVDTAIMLQSAGSFSSIQLDRIYRGNPQNNYTNSYHFVSIPVWYHWQINKGKKLPIQWNAGISLGYLIATNALVYDRSLGGIYYENKEAFTKLHVNLGTGFSVRIKAKNSSEWVIGPELSFDMSRLVKNDSKQYLLFGGINAKIFFPKKKNK